MKDLKALWIAVVVLGVAMPSFASTAPPKPADLAAVDPMVRSRIENSWQEVADQPASSAAWLDLAQVYHAHELTGLAEECYERATDLAPADAKSWYQLALAQYELGEPETALSSLDHVLNLTHSYAPAYWRQGRWLLDSGQPAAAEISFRRATEVDPSDLAGWVGLARVLIDRGEPQQAIQILFRVLSADPANGVAGQLMGLAFRAVGDQESARRALSMGTGMGGHFPDPWQEEVLAQATGIGNQLRLLSARLDRGEVDEVTAKLEELRAAHPLDVGILNKLSEGYLHQRNLPAAMATLQVALKVDPAEFATLMHLAQAYKLEGHLDEALIWADRAIESNPGHWQAYFERASILGRMGQTEECLAAVDAAMSLGATQNPNAWLMQGDVLLRLGQWTRASRAFEQATERFPFLGAAYLGLALARAEVGDLPQARQALAAARRLQQDQESIAAVQARIDAAAEHGK